MDVSVRELRNHTARVIAAVESTRACRPHRADAGDFDIGLTTDDMLA